MTGPRIMVVVGARPNFMKAAPVVSALASRGVTPALVHTGQHYDEAMSDSFFTDLGLPVPDYHLNVGSSTHTTQTARIMEAFEPVLRDQAPNWVVVVGDVNSTLACALATAQASHDLGCRLAHVEAGLRSHDWRMPEEMNRVLTDRLSRLCLTPSRGAAANLRAEGIEDDRIAFVGNVMIDTLYARLGAARASGELARHGVERGGYILVTLHRPSNVDNPDLLSTYIDALREISETLPVVFPTHPRTRAALDRSGANADGLLMIPPVPYTRMLALADGAAAVLTDSGGLQEETTVLGVPCVTLREQTERPVTVTEGTNQLIPWPPSAEGVKATVQAARARGRSAFGELAPEGWDGRAGERVADALLRELA